MSSSDVPLTTAYSVNHEGLLSAAASFSCLLLTSYFLQGGCYGSW